MGGKSAGDFLDRLFCRKADWHALCYWRHPGWQGPTYPGRAAVPVPGPDPDTVHWCVEESHPEDPHGHDFSDPDFVPQLLSTNGHSSSHKTDPLERIYQKIAEIESTG
ncbi:MAG: hypothetical protein HY329_03335 [Chloroflexi bacterium]|nr:hypothetical protein [Chloroflexota bacterium]